MKFFKKKEKDEWWLTEEDKEFIASQRNRSRKLCLIIFLIGVIFLLASSVLKQPIK
jgi:predicted nucleic acid-binding Zn ribbon protein